MDSSLVTHFIHNKSEDQSHEEYIYICRNDKGDTVPGALNLITFFSYKICICRRLLLAATANTSATESQPFRLTITVLQMTEMVVMTTLTFDVNIAVSNRWQLCNRRSDKKERRTKSPHDALEMVIALDNPDSLLRKELCILTVFLASCVLLTHSRRVCLPQSR